MKGPRPPLPAAEIRRRVAALGPWFHNLHLPGGVETAPDHPFGDFPRFKWREIAPHLPGDLTGQKVLDIGCNAGFYSLELARRGAEVLGIDANPHYLRQARFAAELSGLHNLRFEQRSVYRLGGLKGPFDGVLFMGVLYHLRHPLLALDLIAALGCDWLVFQSLTFGGQGGGQDGDQGGADVAGDVDFQSRDRLEAPGWPKLAFIEGTFCKDPTNWWVPNHAAVAGMLRAAGFEIVARPGHEICICRARRGVIPEETREAALAAGAAGHEDQGSG